MSDHIQQLQPIYDFSDLDQNGKIMAEYVWVGGRSAVDMRSKVTTVCRDQVTSIDDLKIWNFDGSSTNQAPGSNSEVLLYPRRIYRDPFRRGNNILVLCDTYDSNGEYVNSNFRGQASDIFDKVADSKCWYGIEQEYTLMDPNTFPKWPLGWPRSGYPEPQGPYYCGVGASYCIGRKIMEDHYKVCLYSGINISGTNGEVMPGQWEFQVGPCEGIDAGDALWMGRYLLMRVAESYNVDVSFEPKPVRGDWNGAGAHTNFSTLPMRQDGGFEVIKTAISRMEPLHEKHISLYGPDNNLRLTGKHETASIDKFSWGVANRGCSIRVPRESEKNGKGYLEDRRPAANCDPYVVTAAIADTVLLDGTDLAPLAERYTKFLRTL
eukprot:CAMPEP_0114983884 /NCGR_PEP_ID=MMETSP0216-20121206/6956_1 /TAXON_ID=223996 /ORGANISM="Protocruzia adherens, Strain Boccale" /LENGTH=378 /DNA_ID=CAMNT_0002345933 /DNA_START=512 /DNA_END=1648 /DNA_ORIENTATION=-